MRISLSKWWGGVDSEGQQQLSTLVSVSAKIKDRLRLAGAKQLRILGTRRLNRASVIVKR